MRTITKQTNVPLWHYQCPDCGISDQDTGYHAATDVIYCEVCLEDARHVRLRRWQLEAPSDDSASPGETPPQG